MTELSLRLLGGFALTRGEERLRGFESDKARALLAYLAVESNHSHRREQLAGLLWPDFGEEAARGNLRRVLVNLRDLTGDREAEQPLLLVTRQTIRFNLEAPCTVDTVVLETGLREARQHSSGTAALEAALGIYAADFLAGFSLPDAAAFEQWIVERRAHFHQLALRGFDHLVNRCEARGDWAAALRAARRQLTIDPAREETHRQIMRLLALTGDRTGALAQFDRCCEVLEQELDVPPAEATVALYEQIRDGHLDASTPPLWGNALRGYELREQIGSGAYGLVYRAYQPAVGRQVAVKVIRPQFANRPEFIRRFEAEAHLVARLDHLHIVPLYDYWRDPEGAFLVMPWLRGGNLQQALQDGPWPPRRVARLLEQIAGALSYAHRRDVVHGDVRAENILLDEEGNAFLSDFGIARDLVQPLPIPETETVSGSTMAVSPEELSGSPASPLSDLYCLGLLLYQLLLGESPLTGKTPREQSAAIAHGLPPLAAGRPDLSPEIDLVVRRATAPDPADRYQDVAALARAFRAAVDGETPPLPLTGEPSAEPINPYKGLRPFGEADEGDFFGREVLVGRWLARLGETGAPRLLAVVGPSGSGKSSAINAGLLPALRRGALPGSADWFIAEMVPGGRPLAALALALRQIAARWPVDAEQTLEDAGGLFVLARQIVPAGDAQLLLVVDQFEELYTRVGDAHEVARFLDLLSAAVTAAESKLRVVIALRADFYDRPLRHRAFGSLLGRTTEVVVPLNRAELLAAVRQPALHAGVRFAPGLAERIVADVSGEPGALPLLQVALTELFAAQSQGEISTAAYEAGGGISGAVARSAEAVYTGLDVTAQELTRQLFLRLVSIGDGREGALPDTRRRVLRSELEELAASALPAAVDKVLEAFGRRRLLTFDRHPETRAPTVEIAHEALLSDWPRLAGWLEQSRDDLRLQRRLAAAAAEWEAAGRPAGLLAAETRLAQYAALAGSGNLALTPSEQAYVAASTAVAAERARRTRRTSTIIRGLGIAAGIAAVIAVILAFFAFAARSTALREATVSQSLLLADTAVEVMEAGETDRALALALAAAAIPDPPPGTLTKLAEVAYGLGTRAILVGDSGMVRAVAFSPDGKEVLAAGCGRLTDDDCAAGELVRWNVEDASIVARWPAHDDWITAVAWHPQAGVALTGAGDGSLIVWDMAADAAVAEQQTGAAAVTAIVLNADGTLATVAAADGTISLIDPLTGAQRMSWTADETALRDVAFSPDGQLLASAAAGGSIKLWNVSSGDIVRTISGHSHRVSGVRFVDDGATILSVSEDLSLRKWNAATGAQTDLRETADRAEGLAVSPDGLSAAHYAGHRLYLWSVADFDAPLQYLSPHQGMIQDLAYSPDGQALLSVGTDGTVRVWNIGSAGDYRQIPLGFPATGLVASPDGQTLAVNEWGSTAHVWDIAGERWLRAMSGATGILAPGAAAVSPDGRYLAGASGTYDTDESRGSVIVWNLASGDVRCNRQGHASRPRTVTFGADAKLLLSGVDDPTLEPNGPILLWDTDTCGIVGHLQMPRSEDNVVSIAVSADGRHVIGGSNSGRVILWDLATAEILRVFELVDDLLLDVAFGPGNESLLAGAGSGNIVQWDLANGAEMRRFLGHDGAVWSLDVSDDQRWLASSDDGGLVILWDLATGTELRRHHIHGGPVYDVAFSADDATLYSVSTDETLVAWPVGDPSLAGLRAWIAENRYLRDLTCAEREQYGVKPFCALGSQ